MDTLLLSIFEYTFLELEEEKTDDRMIIFIEIGRILSVEIIKNLQHPSGDGYKIYTNYKTVKEELNVIRKIGLSPLQKQQNNSTSSINVFNAKFANEKDKFSCSIKIRNELIFSNSNLIRIRQRQRLDEERVAEVVDSKKPKRVALLVPSNNFKSSEVFKCPIMKHLIPTFLKTLTQDESERFKISIYIGYDIGDPILESNNSIGQIKKQTGPYIQIVLIRLPKTGGWLTFIWNKLFVEAMAEGNQYFLQVNDDVEFLSEGWLSKSIEVMDKLEVGVVGLHDSKWNCKLYTQALVNENHYKIFEGRFYPTQLKDWYSDNWISSVYGINGVCMNETEALVRNGQVNTRYSACDDRNYPNSVNEGRDTILRALRYMSIYNDTKVIRGD